MYLNDDLAVNVEGNDGKVSLIVSDHSRSTQNFISPEDALKLAQLLCRAAEKAFSEKVVSTRADVMAAQMKHL